MKAHYHCNDNSIINLFKIINIDELKEKYHITSYKLVDFSVGYDDYIYLLFSQNVPKRIEGMFVNTRANSHYIAFALSVDWYTESIILILQFDCGVLEFNYHYLRPYHFQNGFLLLGARCEYFSESHIEKNAAIISANGDILKMFCLGDGIQDCFTTPDGKIITSYFDEGIFGNYGWNRPIGESGLLVWNSDGTIAWENKNFDIFDCYALNIDSSKRLWFYFYTNFDLVGTDFRTSVVLHPDIKGSYDFAISESQQRIILSGGYNDNNFYLYHLNIHQSKMENKKKVSILLDADKIELSDYKFNYSKLLFITSDNDLCGYNFFA